MRRRPTCATCRWSSWTRIGRPRAASSIARFEASQKFASWIRLPSLTDDRRVSGQRRRVDGAGDSGRLRGAYPRRTAGRRFRSSRTAPMPTRRTWRSATPGRWLTAYARELAASRAEAPCRLISADIRVWFNPGLESRDFMIPGILALVLLVVTTNLSSMAIVREKELGTLEQLNVTPLARWELIVGKLVPYAILGMVDVAAGRRRRGRLVRGAAARQLRAASGDVPRVPAVARSAWACSCRRSRARSSRR